MLFLSLLFFAPVAELGRWALRFVPSFPGSADGPFDIHGLCGRDGGARSLRAALGALNKVLHQQPFGRSIPKSQERGVAAAEGTGFEFCEHMSSIPIVEREFEFGGQSYRIFVRVFAGDAELVTADWRRVSDGLFSFGLMFFLCRRFFAPVAEL
jgi:hypothetical protein